MSKIVLGGASFIQLNNRELSRLLDTAAALGINKIDTAPLYGRSEAKIGSYLKKRKDKNWQISTKVGLPNKLNFNPEGIMSQVNQSLQDLNIEQIETLFVHSLDSSFLIHENIEALKNLKAQGKIKSIGYSGDNQELKYALSSLEFDSIMATYNPLDLGNHETICKATIQCEVFLKRVLANGVWDMSIGKSVKHNLRKIINFNLKPQVHEYFERINFFESKIQGDARTYFNFARVSFPTAFLVLGTSDIGHLVQLRKIEDGAFSISPELIELRLREFKNLDLGSRWKVLT